MKYVKEEVVTSCYHSCNFFGTEYNVMKCTHPYFEDKGADENMIIKINNSRDGNIPEKCPLRNSIEGDTEVVLKIKLKIYEIN